VEVLDYNRILLVVSSEDPAGITFCKVLQERFGFHPTSVDGEVALYRNQQGQLLASIPIPPIYADDLEQRLEPRILDQTLAYIFLAKHFSKEGVPALTAHFPGNPHSEATFGGRPREVAWVWPSLLKNYLQRLVARAGSMDNFDIVMEATHHGPTALSKPVMFVELGSTQREWEKREFAELILEALFEALENFEPARQIALGFGGPHYCHKFMKLILEGSYALAGVVAKYSLHSFDREISDQFLAKSIEPITHVAIDWKGVSGSVRERVSSWASERGLNIIRL
jgi:D-aminoacyl-tRNA deacylase